MGPNQLHRNRSMLYPVGLLISDDCWKPTLLGLLTLRFEHLRVKERDTNMSLSFSKTVVWAMDSAGDYWSLTVRTTVLIFCVGFITRGNVAEVPYILKYNW